MQERGFKEWSSKFSLKKVTLGQRYEENEGESPVDIWGQKREQHEQRSLGRNMPALLKE